MQLLLDYGSDIKAESSAGNALYIASSRGRTKIVQLLLAAGANANTKGGEYGSALRAASMEGHNEIVQLLLDHGADIDV